MGRSGLKRVVVLGSTGSIGTQTLQVLRDLGEEFLVVGLSTHSDISLLAKQIRQFTPQAVAVADPEAASELKTGTWKGDVLRGSEGLVELAALEGVDIVVNGLTGAAGLEPSLAAVRAGRRLALANKESMVLGGSLLKEAAAESGAEILPIDSEHNALYQLLLGLDRTEIRRVMITASGGPFREWPLERIAAATPEEALRHPTWEMGPVITVNSATLVNKALEVIETYHLFDLPYDQISVLVHPQSVVHALVELTDGSLIGHMATPDMAIPIQYALTYPDRTGRETSRCSLQELGRLEFRGVERERFPAFFLGVEAGAEGGTAPVVFNAANEVAVESYLNGRLGFGGIAETVREVLRSHNSRRINGLEAIWEADRWARQKAGEVIEMLEG